METLHGYRLIVPHASIDFAKHTTPDEFLPLGCYSYECSRTDGFPQTEGSGEIASEVCIVIIKADKFLERRLMKRIITD
jgi:hypothetical protein